MEAFKNRYNKVSISEIAQEISKYDKDFNQNKFIKEATKKISKLEMKERVVQISKSLETNLTHSYKKNIKILIQTLKSNGSQGVDNFILWPYTYFIETNGIDDFETSMKALYEITKYFTSEFGVRPFFNQYPKETYNIFKKWAKDPNEHVRRWVSEGTRPNLPWGMKISHLDKNLKKNIDLLELLKNDSSVYVRTSVANHMNDISWIDPTLTLKTLSKWNKNKSTEMTWIVKKSLRSLIKQGNPEALELLGFNLKARSSVKSLNISKNKIKEGESFEISFVFKNTDSKKASFMIDYNIYYQKANGKLSKKTFKLKSLDLSSKEEKEICKKISFKKVTTRKHYPGKHTLEIQVNGKIKGETSFILV